MREHAALIAILLALMQNLVCPALVSPTTRGRAALTAVSPQPTRRRQARRGHARTLCYASLADFEEFEVVENTEQSKNIDKILTLLDEIRDPFNGQTIPAMIGVEYQGPLHVI